MYFGGAVMSKKARLLEFLKITFGIGITAAAVYFFLLPSAVPVGSISSLAMVIGVVLPLPISVITFVLNVVLLIIGFIFIGKEFGGKTVYTSIMLPVFLALFEHLFPNFTSLMGDPFQDMICFVFTASWGASMLFNCNASSGGLDIVAKLLNKYLRLELGKAITVSGMLVAFSALFVYDMKTVVLSVLGTYLNGVILDYFIFGATEKKRVCILTRRVGDVRDFILNTLHSGATIYEALGAYDLEPRQEIVTIVTRGEYRQLMNFISHVDPEAFVSIYTVKDVAYVPKVPGGPSRWTGKKQDAE